MEYLPIIRTSTGGWVAPRDVLVIPVSLQYQGGPLLKPRNCADRSSPLTTFLLESEYDICFLEVLGTQIFNKDDVRRILSTPEFPFHAKGYLWIATLFGYFHANPDADPTSAAYLQLETGEWTAPHVRQMYINESATVPFDLASVSISILNRDFVTEISKIETARLYLTERLKIRMLSEDTMINAIFDRHAQGPLVTDSFPKKLDPKICMAHAQFLSQVRGLIDWDKWIKAVSPFYVITQDKSIREAEETVTNQMVSKKRKTVFPISDLAPSTVPFLSPSYPPDVAQFLAERLGVKPKFPLTENSAVSDCKTVTASTKLHSIFSADKSVRSNFGLIYLSTIWADLPREIRQNNEILRELQNLPCLCQNGQFAPLRQTILPTPKFRRLLSPELEVLDVPWPGNPKWRFLEGFGVTTIPGLDFFFRRLRLRIGNQIPTQPDESFFESLYVDLVAFLRKCHRVSSEDQLRLVYPDSIF